MNLVAKAKRNAVLQTSLPPSQLSLWIHPKCGCQENPFSSHCCMSGVPRAAALPVLSWSAHQHTHTPNPACFQGLLKLYQLMKHIRCQILRFLFFFTASYQFFVETWRKKNSLLSGRFEVSMWKHQVPAEQGFHMLDLWARHNQANGKTCEVISECSLVCPWVLGCVLALTSAFIHSVMDSCQSSSQWASLMSCFVPKACLYCVFRGNTPGRLCSG